MKHIRKLTTILMFLFAAATHADNSSKENLYLANYCKNLDGKIITKYVCPETGVVRNEDFCIFPNEYGQNLIFNGCNSDNQNGYRIHFFKACILHDLCYHSEPKVSGKTKTDCDKMFKENMLQICRENDLQEHFMCKTMARIYYKAVASSKGEPSWLCIKDNAKYPTSLEQLPVVF